MKSQSKQPFKAKVTYSLARSNGLILHNETVDNSNLSQT
jgi:hypothetical protein